MSIRNLIDRFNRKDRLIRISQPVVVALYADEEDLANATLLLLRRKMGDDADLRIIEHSLAYLVGRINSARNAQPAMQRMLEERAIAMEDYNRQ